MTAALAAPDLWEPDWDRYPGIVRPHDYSLPRFDRTLGPAVGAVCELAGFPPDPEQQLALDVGFGIGPNGKSVASSIAALACRQNLKTGLVKQFELGWLFVTDERLIVHSAHEFATSREAFRDVVELIEGSSELCRMIPANGVHRGNGDEAIETKTGARLVFRARTKTGGRGLSGRKVVLDEAFALRMMHMGALLPILSAQPDPQVLFASSAALADSEVLHDVVARGLSRRDPRLAFLQWCMDPPRLACDDGDACSHARDVAGCGLDKFVQRLMANPQLGKRIAPETLDDERRTLDEREFGRERGGWHDSPASGASILDGEKWLAEARVDDEGAPASTTRGPVVFAVSMRPDGLHASIVVAGQCKRKRDRDRVHLELVEHRPGSSWVVPRLVELFKAHKAVALVVNPTGSAGSLLEDLRDAGFEACGRDASPAGDNFRLHLVTAREYSQACGALVNDVRNDDIRHIGQAPLNDAVKGARTRTLADAYAWSWKESLVDIAPLEAATLARHGFAVFGDAATPEPWAFSA